MARGVKGANPFGPLYMIIALLTVGLAIAILVIVNNDLWAYWSGCYWLNWYQYVCGSGGWDTCWMQVPGSSVNLCYYSWAAAAVGLFFSLWLFFMQLCSGRSRHIPVCEVIVCLFALLWWIGAATTATVYAKDADSWSTDPANVAAASTSGQALTLQEKKGWRTAVWACGWACVGLWALALLTTLKDCASARKNPPAQEPVYAGGPPPGAYAAPVYQTQAPAYPTYQAPGTGAYPAPPPAQPYGGAPPAYGAPAPGAPAGYPPASPFQGADAAPAGYPTNPTV